MREHTAQGEPRPLRSAVPFPGHDYPLLPTVYPLYPKMYGVWSMVEEVGRASSMVEEVGRAWSMVEEVGRGCRLQPVIEDIVDAAELTVLLQGLRV